MADATSNFGQSRSNEYGEIKMALDGKPIDPKTAGTFKINKVLKEPAFDPQARLTSTGGGMRIRVDGIQAPGARNTITRSQTIELLKEQLKEQLAVREKNEGRARELGVQLAALGRATGLFDALKSSSSFHLLDNSTQSRFTKGGDLSEKVDSLNSALEDELNDVTVTSSNEIEQKWGTEISELENALKKITSELQQKAQEDSVLKSNDLKERSGRIRIAAQLSVEFSLKKIELTTLLQNESVSGLKADADLLIRKSEALKPALQADDVTDKTIEDFRETVADIQVKIDEVKNIIDGEKSRQESMMSLHASWPKEIKYVEAKKSNKPGVPGEKAGWKKDGVLLKEQVIWGRLNDQAKRVFDKYNALVDKALILSNGDEVKDLVVIKEQVISALYKEGVTTAQVELTRLEKEVETRRGVIENALEEKELGIKLASTIAHLERLTNIAELEKELLEAKLGEIRKLSEELGKVENKDDTKRKELLRQYRALLGELVTAVEEKDKDTKREASERLSEFKKLTRRLEEARVEITHRLPAGIPDKDKEVLLKKLGEIEAKAKDFSKHEVVKEYDKARESLILFEASLAELKALTQEKIAGVAKSQEAKSAEAKEFGKAVTLFEQLKTQIGDLGNVSDIEKVSFDKLVAELEELKKSRAEGGDKQDVDQKDLLFRSLLSELTSFVTQKMGNEDRLKDEIAALKQKLAETSSERMKDQLLQKIAQLERAFNGILSLKEGRRSTAPRRKTLRPVNSNATVFLREKDPLTGKPLEMKMSKWEELQKSSAQVSGIEKEERRSQSEDELKSIHKAMWERDKEGYKRLYAGRVWSKSEGNDLVQKIVKELLGEKVALVDNELKPYQEELDERNVLMRKLTSGVLTPTEKERLTELENKLSSWLKERESLTETFGTYSEEEQKRLGMASLIQNNELKNQRQTYSPANDRTMDYFPIKGQAGEEFRKRGLSGIFTKNSEAQQRYQLAKHAVDQESARARRGSIPGFTKAAVNTSPLMGKMPEPITQADFVDVDPTKEGLGKDIERLAEAVYRGEVTLGSKEDGLNGVGMRRSITTEDAPWYKDASKVLNMALENGPQPVAQTERVLTPEEQERKVAKINSIMGTIKKFAKSWRAWAMIGALAAGVGVPVIAFAAEDIGPSTLEQALSWKDFIDGMSEREQTSLRGFIRDLTSK